MDTKKALGRGLGALLREEEILEAGSPGYFLCPLDRLRPNPRQPRQSIDEQDLSDLAASIKEKGVLQPLVVRKADEQDGAYEIIAGERRFRAAQMAGLATVPVVIKDVSPEEVLELALIENIQRKDLTPIEEALAYKRLLEEYGITQQELSKRVGKDRSTIANSLRLLKLPSDIQEDIAQGHISMGHARALLMLEGLKEAMYSLRDRIKKDGLSVRQAEAMARALLEKGPNEPRIPKKEDPNIKRLSDELTFEIGFRVKVVPKKRGGKVEIYYGDLDELDRIVELLERRTRGDT